MALVDDNSSVGSSSCTVITSNNTKQISPEKSSEISAATGDVGGGPTENVEAANRGKLFLQFVLPVIVNPVKFAVSQHFILFPL